MPRNKLPEETLKLRGTYRKDRRKYGTGKELQEEPDILKGLPEGSVRFWKELIKDIRGNGTLFKSDSQAIGAACMARFEYQLAIDEIEKSGIIMTSDRGTKSNPAIIMAHNAWNRWLRALREFGLTPASRENVDASTESEDDQDEVSKMFA